MGLALVLRESLSVWTLCYGLGHWITLINYSAMLNGTLLLRLFLGRTTGGDTLRAARGLIPCGAEVDGESSVWMLDG